MSPAERHTLFQHLTERGLSGRAAGRWAGFSRAVASYALRRPAQQAAQLEQIRLTSQAHPRYGYRRIAVVSGLGFGKTWRLWQQNGLQLAAQRSRQRRPANPTAARPHRAAYPNHVWTYDFLLDRLADGRPFKTLSVLNEFTRECLTILAAGSIRKLQVIAVLHGLMVERGAPAFLRSDNGSEFTATAVQTTLAQAGIGPAFIPPGQPWKNGFHDKFRDECLQREWFQSLLEAQTVIENWRKQYNTERPHSSLGYQTPAAFAAGYPFQTGETLIPDGHKI
jgi:transposase InsO family protein